MPTPSALELAVLPGLQAHSLALEPFSLPPRADRAPPATAQDPIDRSMAQAARVKKISEQSEALKESWEAPTKSFGFWTGANTTAKYSFNLDLAKTGPGRWVGWGRE